MTEARDRTLSLTPDYYEIRGRAAEIARTLGSPVGGAEHLFLAMLHDGGWPVSVICGLVDLGRAEAAVLAILDSPGYSPPPPPRLLFRPGFVRLWGAEVAFEMGDSYLGLDSLEAAVLTAKNAPASGPGEDAVFLPDGLAMDGPLRRAIADALPDGTTYALGTEEGGRTWVRVIGPAADDNPGLTRDVLNTALASRHPL
jgi:hypothetical protein